MNNRGYQPTDDHRPQGTPPQGGSGVPRKETDVIVVTIDMWPGGTSDHKYSLGTAVIINDGTGTKEKGNYTAMMKTYGRDKKEETSKVSGYNRNEDAWGLLKQIIKERQ